LGVSYRDIVSLLGLGRLLRLGCVSQRLRQGCSGADHQGESKQIVEEGSMASSRHIDVREKL